MSLSRFSKISIALVLGISVAGCAVVDRVQTDLSLASAHTAYDAGRYAEAETLYRKAADAGNGEAAYMLSDMYLDGRGVKKDTSTGVRLMQQAADNKYLPADVSIGLWTLGGVNGVRRDAAKGAQMILKAAQAGQPDAMLIMGSLYMKGRGVRRDANEALGWFQKANAQGQPVGPDLLTLGGIEKKMAIKRR